MQNLVIAAYHHAQQNPTAAGHGRPLDEAKYADSPLIVEPFHLFDCSREHDGAVAQVRTSAERAASLDAKHAYILASAQAAPGGYSALHENDGSSPSAGFSHAALRPALESRYGQQAGRRRRKGRGR